MNLEDSIKAMREQLPKVKLVSAVLFDGDYLFRTKNEGNGSGGIAMYGVNKNGDVYSVDMKEIFNRLEEFNKSETIDL